MRAVHPDLEQFIFKVREYPDAPFYREHWGDASFDALPTITREDFVRAPMQRRRYKKEKTMTKIVSGDEYAFLSEWSFEDIGREPWGVPSKRPMVYLADPHEAIEKSMWCYENGMVPLIGEKNADITLFMASRYAIDSLITDAVSIHALVPYLKAHVLESITILGESFDIPALLPFRAYARDVRLVLRLPEVGAIAQAQLALSPVFTAVPDCILEQQKEALIVTKASFLVTPVINYRTSVAVEMLPSSGRDSARFTLVC